MRLIGLAFGLLLLGFLLVFSTVLRVIEANFLLMFLAYAGSVTGLCLGYVGIARTQRSGPVHRASTTWPYVDAAPGNSAGPTPGNPASR